MIAAEAKLFPETNVAVIKMNQLLAILGVDLLILGTMAGAFAVAPAF